MKLIAASASSAGIKNVWSCRLPPLFGYDVVAGCLIKYSHKFNSLVKFKTLAKVIMNNVLSYWLGGRLDRLKHAASICTVEDKGSGFVLNTSSFTLDYTASHPKI